jgi:hypothetical protein
MKSPWLSEPDAASLFRQGRPVVLFKAVLIDPADCTPGSSFEDAVWECLPDLNEQENEFMIADPE